MDKNILVGLRSQGHTIRAIAAQLGVSTHQVNYWLKRYGLTKTRARIDPELYGKIRTTYQSTGWSTRKLATLLGVSQSTVCAALDGLEKNKARYVRPFKLEPQQLKGLAGLSTHQAAKLLNVPAMSVHRAFKRLRGELS